MGDTGRTISMDELTKLLAPALGEEKSEEIVLATARSLGFTPPYLSASEVRALFTAMAATEGLVGVVARFAISRGDVDALVDSARTESARNPRASETSSAKGRFAPVDLLPLLAPALGTEKARDAVTASALRQRFDPRRLSHDEALAVLDDLAHTEGIVGVVARFAKARFLLES